MLVHLGAGVLEEEMSSSQLVLGPGARVSRPTLGQKGGWPAPSKSLLTLGGPPWRGLGLLKPIMRSGLQLQSEQVCLCRQVWSPSDNLHTAVWKPGPNLSLFLFLF